MTNVRSMSVRLIVTGVLTAGVCALAACGPVRTASMIKDAQFKLDEAHKLDAEKNAPYEYTRAKAYLHKAKELEGSGDFEQAETFADRSGDMSEKAQDVARLAAERNARKNKFGKKPATDDAPAVPPTGGR